MAAALQTVFDLHRADFLTAQRPVAPPPPQVTAADFLSRHAAEAKAATSVFARAERKAALAEAARRAEIDAEAQRRTYAEQQEAWQAALDEQWQSLVTNDEDAVLTALAEAFEDNEAAAAAVGVAGESVSIVVLVPHETVLPERRPTTTPAGNLSLKKMTKREVADFYKLLICGHVLATVKEAFAVAPGLDSARVVAIRARTPDAYGKQEPEVLLATQVHRSALDGICWADADAVRIVNDAGTDTIMVQKGATSGLVPVDLDGEPDLRSLVDAVDLEDLVER